MLKLLKGSKKTVGIKQSTKALNNNKVEKLFIAEDADDNLTQNMTQIAKAKSVDINYSYSMKELGEACKIDVGAAVVALLNK